MSNRFGLFVVFMAFLPSTVPAQQQTTTVTGTVVDSSNRPMSGVLVFVDEGPGSATTGAVGAFRLEGVTAGTHLLNLRKAGFAPRAFNLVFAPNEDGRDVGVIVLEEGPYPTATLTGRVVEGTNGTPVVGAEVELNGDLLAVSGDDGRFHIPGVPITWGSNQLRVGGLSYTDETAELWIADPNETLELSVTLHPEPIELSGVVARVARPQQVAEVRETVERVEHLLGELATDPVGCEYRHRRFVAARSPDPGGEPCLRDGTGRVQGPLREACRLPCRRESSDR